MNFLKKTYYFFSDYTGPAERRVAKFFSKIRENQEVEEIKPQLLELIQSNVIAINLWSEYKYRQYKYLKKSERKQLYVNVSSIVMDFKNHLVSGRQNSQPVLEEIQALSLDGKIFADKIDRLMYLKSIMSFLAPEGGRYVYRKSSTFGALLKDPTKEPMVGDCNQIVTLYVYLYSLKFDVSELQLRTFPGHVALHFNGVDIEATAGRFMHYKFKDQSLLPIQELISLNLLDTSDEYFKTHKVSAEALLEAARVGYVLSSQRQVVAHNLAVAYNNAVVELMNGGSYQKALDYAKQSGNRKLITTAGHNGALYFMQQEQFTKALDFAAYSNQKEKLRLAIYQSKGAYYFDKGDYHTAIKAFENSGDSGAVKSCYAGLFNNERKKLGKISTVEDIKANQKTIHNMAIYAKNSGSQNLISYVDDLKKHL